MQEQRASCEWPVRSRARSDASGSDIKIDQDDESLHQEDKYCLPYFQASLFATILEDTITEMRILVGSNSALTLSKAVVDLPSLRARKFAVAAPASADELDGVDPRNLGAVHYKINKLDADRNAIHASLLKLYLGLSVPRTYGPLAEQVATICERNNHYNFLIEDEAKNKILRRELCKQLRQRRNHIKSVYYDTDCAIENLKSQVEDAALNAEIRSRYVVRWQRARSEQHAAALAAREAEPAAALERHKAGHDTEQRVHAEIDLLVTITINETLQKVETWMNKYDKDIEAMDIRIQRMKTKHVEAVERREKLEETIETHAKLIKQWVEFKDERERLRQYREKMTRAAVVVQAWWRGLLVRNQLGPYKPLPKGRKPPPAKKK